MTGAIMLHSPLPSQPSSFVLTGQETDDYYWMVVFVPSATVFAASVVYYLIAIIDKHDDEAKPCSDFWNSVLKNHGVICIHMSPIAIVLQTTSFVYWQDGVWDVLSDDQVSKYAATKEVVDEAIAS